MTRIAIPIVRYRLIFSSLLALSSVEVAILFYLPVTQRNSKKRVIAERTTMIDVNCSVFFNAFSNLSMALYEVANQVYSYPRAIAHPVMI